MQKSTMAIISQLISIGKGTGSFDLTATRASFGAICSEMETLAADSRLVNRGNASNERNISEPLVPRAPGKKSGTTYVWVFACKCVFFFCTFVSHATFFQAVQNSFDIPLLQRTFLTIKKCLMSCVITRLLTCLFN